MGSQAWIEKAIDFHGHFCPGLSVGLRAGLWCLEELGHASDEEIVAIVETDMCAVDAIQVLSGCTFGKGNLIYRDYGKVAFSFFRRTDGKCARLFWNRSLIADLRKKNSDLSPEHSEKREEIRREMIDRIMDAPLDEVFHFGPPNEKMPEKARIWKSVPCSRCREEVMETRLLCEGELRLCIPCSSPSQLCEER